MRVTGGLLKGGKIEYIKSSITRPLKDLIKESIFNIINHSNLLNINLVNSDVLDLYSGVGSFGIECISRGASKLTFIEKDKKAVEIIKKNLETLNILKKTNIYNEAISVRIHKLKRNSFDIVFLDPPFTTDIFKKDLEAIRNFNLLKKKHLIIIHREAKFNDKLDGLIKIILERKYGRSRILFGFFC